MRFYFSVVVLSIFCFNNSFSQTKKFVINEFTNDTGMTSAIQSILLKDKSIVILSQSFFFPSPAQLIKMDSTGNIIWSRVVFPQINSSFLVSKFIETIDHGFLILGYINPDTIFDNNAGILKVDSVGNFEWGIAVGDTNMERVASGVQLSDSSYVITGSTWNTGVPEQVIIIKLDKYGNLMWAKTCDSGTRGIKIINTSDGGWAVSSVAYFMKFDHNDSLQWIRVIGSFRQKFLLDLIQTSDNSFVFGGIAIDSLGNDDNMIAKLDSAGNPQWIRYVDVSNNDGVKSIIETSDGGILACADTAYFFTGGLIVGSSYIFKLGPNGDFKWGQLILDSLVANSAIELPGNKILISGYTRGYGALPNGLQMFFVVTDSIGGNCSDQMTTGDIYTDILITDIVPGIPVLPFTFPSSSMGYGSDWTPAITVICESFPTETKFILLENQVAVYVYPNPSPGVVHFQISDDYGRIEHLEIFDALGRSIYSKNGIHDRIDVDIAQNGFYFYRLRSTNESDFKGKLLIE